MQDKPSKWKRIVNYPNYLISSDGRIFSLNYYRFLKLKNHPKGYLYTALVGNGKRKGFKVHRLVAQHFIPNPENKPEVNHINAVRSDNKVENLEWVTSQENINHTIKTKGSQVFASMKGRTGANSPYSKKLKQYDLNGNLIKIWDGHKEMERTLGLFRQGIYYHIKNNTEKVYGYKWSY